MPDEKFPPALETERLRLRPMELSDAADIFEYASDEENVRDMLFDAHANIYDTINFLSGERIKYDNKACYDYAIILKDTGKLIGTGGVFEADKLPHSANIGYILNKKYWGKGYATEAMTAVVNFCFNVLRVRRVEAWHIAENEKSGIVMKKLGMVYEGTKVDGLYLKGAYRTMVMYGLIRDAWAESICPDQEGRERNGI
ncbi:MAG: GNAT family N-acetyltransferase [Clostridiales bacterium]|jgi:ribosomal-protein-alanine N-acetyltransferase|nr:GNAT family N-acetyltransferase [Clostridiales bacterium]